MGGGTSNISIVNYEMGIIEVIAYSGDSHLGGDDFTYKIVENCCEKIEKTHFVNLRNNIQATMYLNNLCENAKCILSSLEETSFEIDSINWDS